jgi:hypothetical protein
MDMDGTLSPVPGEGKGHGWAKFDGPAWINVYAVYRMPIRKAVFEFVEEMVSEGVDFRWLTTWDGDANIVAEKWGLPGQPWPVEQRGPIDHPPAGKKDAVLRVLQENPEARIVWADDHANNIPNIPNLLVVKPRYKTFGLTDKNLLAIKEFLFKEPNRIQ